MGVSRLAYLGGTTTDLAAWRRYATEVMGIEVSPDSNERLLYLRADERHHRLAFHPGPSDDVAYIGWDVESRGALEGTARALEAAGVRVHAGRASELAERRVLELVWFTCPHTEVRMELTVGAEVTFYPRFTSTRDISGFVMAEQGLGHAVLLTGDLLATADFYVRTLGFGVSDYVFAPGGAPVGAFLHCNARHHSLAFFAVPMSERGRKIQHLMMETRSIDDVGRSYDLCLERKLTKSSLGRHPDDRGLSFYFKNPSRWLFEYAWQLRTIDPRNWTVEKYVMGSANGWGHAGLFSPD